MNSVQDVWNAVYQKISDAYTPTAANTWFAGAQPLAMNSKCFKLQVPSDFQKEIIINRFGDKLTAFLTELVGFSLEVVIYSEEEQEQRKRIAERIVDVDDITSHSLSQDDYTFENFIVGGSNKLAEAACRAVANHTEDSFNPLFIYGGSGLGKTHLLCAIRNSVRAKNPSMKVLYLKGDEFTNEMVEAISQGVAARKIFREKYRYLDMLLIDDIQFIGGKESTQEEFFHTFNTLYEGKKQIVLTSDRPPKEIKTLEERLRTRFEWGLIADIQPPDIETRIAILNRKAKDLGVDLSPEVADYIAQRLKKNIRQLEGAIKKLKALLILDHVEINIAAAQNAIRDVLSDNVTVPVLIDRVLSEVSSYFGLTAEDLCSKKRTAEIAMARQIAMYAIREMAAVSLTQIGDVFGGRDHTTVMHSIHKVEDEMKVNPHLKSDVDEIMANIKAAGEY
ncbi:MAG TPA: chromosomal replication initiator protein DnaA [Candidatus Galloscillospira excrementipullorum]|nr:chromosomal replication initiator protein DnaA [Candidatus Galloscillospira excrementipullorum]